MKRTVPAPNVREEMQKLNLTAPAALCPSDRAYPAITSAEFDEGRETPPYFIDVKLEVVWNEDRAPRSFIIRSNLNGDGAVALATVAGKIMLIRQRLLPLGRYT